MVGVVLGTRDEGSARATRAGRLATVCSVEASTSRTRPEGSFLATSANSLRKSAGSSTSGPPRRL